MAVIIGKAKEFNFEEGIGLTQAVIDLKNEELTYFRIDEVINIITDNSKWNL